MRGWACMQVQLVPMRLSSKCIEPSDANVEEFLIVLPFVLRRTLTNTHTLQSCGEVVQILAILSDISPVVWILGREHGGLHECADFPGTFGRGQVLHVACHQLGMLRRECRTAF